MKFVLKNAEVVSEAKLRFYLEVNSDAMVTVRAIADDGTDWSIVTIQPGGIFRYAVPLRSGFQLKDGRIKDCTV